MASILSPLVTYWNHRGLVPCWHPQYRQATAMPMHSKKPLCETISAVANRAVAVPQPKLFKEIQTIPEDMWLGQPLCILFEVSWDHHEQTLNESTVSNTTITNQNGQHTKTLHLLLGVASLCLDQQVSTTIQSMVSLSRNLQHNCVV